MDRYGLIGFPLIHSFSAGFFNGKFQKEGVIATYLNFEIEDVHEIHRILQTNPDLRGLNVTIPHKEKVIPLLDKITPEAEKIGAVNTIRVEQMPGEWNTRILVGHNTDYVGFKDSISPLLIPEVHRKALVLGTGGASKAVTHALADLGIQWKYVSRTGTIDRLSYNDLSAKILSEYTVIINTSPVGTFPDVDQCPNIPYEYLSPYHLLYDLVYNPEETLFLKKGKDRGAVTKNGNEMLKLQALAAWDFWNSGKK